MSAAVHRIEGGQFVCSADADASCRIYPGCECETWSVEFHGEQPAPGHEPTPQPECWIWQWLTATDLVDTYIDEDGNDVVYGSTFPDGPVEYEWDCDYMTWHYADETQPVLDGEDES